MRLHTSSTLLAVATLLALAACSPAENTKPSDAAATATGTESAAATVNGTVITQRMVDLIAKRGADAGRPDTPEARAKIIDQLALQIVLADEAVKKGLDKGPEVADQIEAIRQSVLANAYVEDYLKNNPVSDETIQAAYDRIKANITGNEYKVRHILVTTESEAKDIIAKLKKDPASFEKLAKERSTDQGSKDQGGDIGWFDLKGMEPDFAVAVTKLGKGKFTTDPVKTRAGYHVILLEDFKPIEAPALDDVKVQLTQQIQQQNLKKQVEALKAAAKIEIAGASPSPAPADSAPPSTN